MKPTASRCDGKYEGKIMKDEMEATLGSACRGLSLSR
jgi:hypothetical protein